LISAAAAMLLANIPGTSTQIISFFTARFTNTQEEMANVSFLSLPNSWLIVINDFLMTFFFFSAGMEIKREIITGELASFKQSLLPIGAAIGGMIVPALLFLLINQKTQYQSGWGIPMATDIAFTLGATSLLGKRVPLSLKIFITALAIIDDLGAMAVIAFFYGGSIHWLYLSIAMAIVVFILIANKLSKSFGIVQWLLGAVLWYALFHSGIHATISGVIFAFLIPTKQLVSYELKVHTTVYFFILPLFVFANTTIIIPSDALSLLKSTLSFGIIAGLCLGKPLGILLAVFLLKAIKLAKFPQNVTIPQMIGAAILCGIGFTMSIFMTNLAFVDVQFIQIGKMAVLAASTISIIVGVIWLRLFGKSK